MADAVESSKGRTSVDRRQLGQLASGMSEQPTMIVFRISPDYGTAESSKDNSPRRQNGTLIKTRKGDYAYRLRLIDRFHDWAGAETATYQTRDGATVGRKQSSLIGKGHCYPIEWPQVFTNAALQGRARPAHRSGSHYRNRFGVVPLWQNLAEETQEVIPGGLPASSARSVRADKTFLVRL